MIPLTNLLSIVTKATCPSFELLSIDRLFVCLRSKRTVCIIYCWLMLWVRECRLFILYCALISLLWKEDQKNSWCYAEGILNTENVIAWLVISLPSCQLTARVWLFFVIYFCMATSERRINDLHTSMHNPGTNWSMMKSIILYKQKGEEEEEEEGINIRSQSVGWWWMTELGMHRSTAICLIVRWLYGHTAAATALAATARRRRWVLSCSCFAYKEPLLTPQVQHSSSSCPCSHLSSRSHPSSYFTYSLSNKSSSHSASTSVLRVSASER